MANACNDKMLNYQVCIALSLIFTLALSVYARTQEYFTQDPQRGMKIYSVCGTIKIFIGWDIIHGPLPRWLYWLCEHLWIGCNYYQSPVDKQGNGLRYAIVARPIDEAEVTEMVMEMGVKAQNIV